MALSVRSIEPRRARSRSSRPRTSSTWFGTRPRLPPRTAASCSPCFEAGARWSPRARGGRSTRRRLPPRERDADALLASVPLRPHERGAVPAQPVQHHAVEVRPALRHGDLLSRPDLAVRPDHGGLEPVRLDEVRVVYLPDERRAAAAQR